MVLKDNETLLHVYAEECSINGNIDSSTSISCSINNKKNEAKNFFTHEHVGYIFFSSEPQIVAPNHKNDWTLQWHVKWHENEEEVVLDTFVETSPEACEQSILLEVANLGSFMVRLFAFYGYRGSVPVAPDCQRILMKDVCANGMILMGHRGMGISHEIEAAATENTMRAFKLACDIGVSMVELDVHVSMDNEICVYHDFHFDRIEDGDRLLATENSWMQMRNVSNNNERAEDEQFFPKLEELLSKLPVHLGFNLELKVPVMQKNGAWSNGLFASTIDGAQSRKHEYSLNRFVDQLLGLLYRYSSTKRRVLFLSCFNPETVVMLRLKQNHWPVLFIGRGPLYSSIINANNDMVHVDMRSRSVLSLVRWAQLQSLDGVVTAVNNFLAPTDGVQLAHECTQSAMPWFVWGCEAGKPEVARSLKAMGCSGLILDDVANVVPLLLGL